MSDNHQVLLTPKGKNRNFVLWTTVIAFVVSSFFIFTTFRGYNAFTDEIEDQARIPGGIAPTDSAGDELSTQDSFSAEDFALVAAIMFAVLGVITLIPLVIVASHKRYLALDADGKTLLIARSPGAKAMRVALSEVASVRPDDHGFGEDLEERKPGDGEHEHDLLIELSSGKLVRLSCPSYRAAEAAAQALAPKLSAASA